MQQTKMVIPKHPCVIWFSHNENDSIGLLFIDGVFQHYIVGDEPRDQKVKGETRIRAGIYPLKLRTIGGFHQRYSRKFPTIHEGMIWITETPEFEFLLYHIMNDEGDTDGCVGGGDQANNNQIGPAFVGASSAAYERTYPKLLEYVKTNPKPILEVIDMDDYQVEERSLA